MHRLNIFWKMFLALLSGTIISLITLLVAFRLTLPFAFTRHFNEMRSMMGGGMGMSGRLIANQLFSVFNLTIREALFVALPIVFLIALVASWLIGRQITSPLRRLFAAAQNIAQGKYNERVPLSENLAEEEMDDLQRLAAGFNQMASSLEQTETLRRQLIADISHELRTPLTTIKGSMEGLIDGVLPANNETYSDIQHEATRLQRLVDDLQELSRIEGGAFNLEREPVSLYELSQRLSKRLSASFETKDVRLENTIDPSLALVDADPDRLEQILLNLVNNALQHTPPEGWVRLEAEIQNHTAVIKVKDNGEGISPEHLPHVFTRFYRVDKSRSRQAGGSGVGLTITQYLVEAHGGHIQAESPGPGKGSTFTFTLPLADGQ